jgi:hypothetical protein
MGDKAESKRGDYWFVGSDRDRFAATERNPEARRRGIAGQIARVGPGCVRERTVDRYPKWNEASPRRPRGRTIAVRN